jgi:RNA-directed DNA polymerase
MNEWEEICSFSNLCRAAKRAARGKRHVAAAARFLQRLEPEVLSLEQELRTDSWRASPPTTFVISDPKVREISAAPFRDRVVHHALIDPLEQRFDAALCDQTFACRRDLGTHRALNSAQELVRRHSHFLKLDIAKCFMSIQHVVVLDTLAPFRLSTETMRLVVRILAGAGKRLGCGLPIGNLTSQWFANLVLGRIDQFVQGELGIPGYVRYMDDFVLLADSKRKLRSAHESLFSFVRTELRLELKASATILAPVSQGLPFLGWRLYRSMRRLRPENLRRTRKRLKHRRWELQSGRIDTLQYTDALRSVLAHLDQGVASGPRSGSMGLPFADEQELGSGFQAPRNA